tara:strand:- start:3650 stop:4252 length:603 start_codon:yes stop_codon:yes gene_type:complete
LTQAHVNVALLKSKLIDLLHPDQRGLVRNVKLSRYVQTFIQQPGIFQYSAIDIHDCICVLVRGVIGVKHDFEGREAITHFYQEGDLFLSTEIDNVYNKQGSYWRIYEDIEMLLLPLKSDMWQQEQPLLASALNVQASLMAAFTYQKFINNLGLDRKSYSLEWLKANKRLLSLVPRMDIANYLDISKSSLKSYIKIAFNDG